MINFDMSRVIMILGIDFIHLGINTKCIFLGKGIFFSLITVMKNVFISTYIYFFNKSATIAAIMRENIFK